MNFVVYIVLSLYKIIKIKFIFGVYKDCREIIRVFKFVIQSCVLFIQMVRFLKYFKMF